MVTFLIQIYLLPALGLACSWESLGNNLSKFISVFPQVFCVNGVTNTVSCKLAHCALPPRQRSLFVFAGSPSSLTCLHPPQQISSVWSMLLFPRSRAADPSTFIFRHPLLTNSKLRKWGYALMRLCLEFGKQLLEP